MTIFRFVLVRGCPVLSGFAPSRRSDTTRIGSGRAFLIMGIGGIFPLPSTRLRRCRRVGKSVTGRTSTRTPITESLKAGLRDLSLIATPLDLKRG